MVIMADGFAYCETLLREDDKERYLASLFAPADRRQALFSLYAFDLETASVAARVHEPLAGEIRLQWWQDALAGNIADQAAGHPVAAAFLDTMRRFDLPRDTIAALIEARRLRLYDGESSDPAALNEFAKQTTGGVLALACHILDGTANRSAEHLSEAAALAVLVDAELSAEIPAELRKAARESLQRARALMDKVPERVLPAFLPLALVNARFSRVERGLSPDLPQWRRQWILWRASKNPARWLA